MSERSSTPVLPALSRTSCTNSNGSAATSAKQHPCGPGGSQPQLEQLSRSYHSGSATQSINSTQHMIAQYHNKHLDSTKSASTLLPDFPTAVDKAAAVPGIPVSRHLAKLEECAKLHEALQETHDALRILKQHSEGQQREYEHVLSEAERVQDVLAVVTGEMQAYQERVRALEAENMNLRAEIQQLRQTSNRAAGGSAFTGSGGGVTAPASGSYGATTTNNNNSVYQQQQQHPASDDRPYSGSTQLSYSGGVASAEGAAVMVPNDEMMEYTVESFRATCEPHTNVLHSLYRNDGKVVVTTPAIDYAQLSVLHRLLVQPSTRMSMWAVSHLHTLSIRFTDIDSGIALLASFMPALPYLHELEIFDLVTTPAMRRLCESLLPSAVVALSLPELAVDDEGLQLLWSTLKQRLTLGERVVVEGDGDDDLHEAGLPAAYSSAPSSSKNATQEVLTMHTLDLSRCDVRDTMTLRQLCCPGLQVLLLPGCDAMTDSCVESITRACPNLHTADFSGCVKLTTACIAFFNKFAPQLAVLRLENCPLIRSLHLQYVEVLFSSLSHVMGLHMPALKRLPVPISNRSVLTHAFVAPQLEELTCHGMMIDALALCPALCTENNRRPVPRRPAAQPQPQAAEPEVRDEEDAEAAPQQEEGENADGNAAAVEEKPVMEASVESNVTLPPQLLVLVFEECTFTEPDKCLQSLLRQQVSLLKLSFHNCKGIRDEHLCGISSTLLELDFGHVGSLTDLALSEIVLHAPHVMRLSLKGAGAAITNEGIRRLNGLTEMQELNLLQLDSANVTADVVSAMAASLPQLTTLFHETAMVVSGGAAAPGRGGSALLHIERVDEETNWIKEMRECPAELLRLRHTAALTLWKEKRLPKASTLMPLATARTAAANTDAASIALNFTPHPPRTTLRTPTPSTFQQTGMAADSNLYAPGATAATMSSGDIEGDVEGQSPLSAEALAQVAGTQQHYPEEGRPASAASSSSSEGDHEERPEHHHHHQRLAEPSAEAVAVMEQAQLGPWGEEDTLAEQQQEVARQQQRSTSESQTSMSRSKRASPPGR